MLHWTMSLTRELKIDADFVSPDIAIVCLLLFCFCIQVCFEIIGNF